MAEDFLLPEKHPIQSLPRELLGYIFRLYPTPVRYRKGKDGVNGPFVLASVCKSWRALAFSTVHLWNDIVIPLYPQQYKPSLQVEMTEQCLRSSGALPLYLEIREVIPKPYTFQDFLSPKPHPVIAAINARSRRWKYIDIKIQSALVLQLNGDNTGYPILDHLIIRKPVMIERQNFVAFNTGSGAPFYPSIVRMFNTTLNTTTIGWNHVKQVRFHMMHMDNLLGFLHCAPLLEVLEITFLIDWEPSSQLNTPPSTLPLVHSNLKSFSMLDVAELPKLFFEQVTLPALDYIYFSSDEELPAPMDDFYACIIKSSPPLSTVIWSGFDLETRSVVEFFRTCKKTEKLELISCAFPHKALFSTLATDEEFLPNLKQLNIHLSSFICMGNAFEWEYVLLLFPNLFTHTDGARPGLALRFTLYCELERSLCDDYVGPELIPRHLIAAFEILAKRGVLEIDNRAWLGLPRERRDFIEESAEFHRTAPASDDSDIDA